MKDYIEKRALEIAKYIIDEKATVRKTARVFGVSKSTVHIEVTKKNCFSPSNLCLSQFIGISISKIFGVFSVEVVNLN